MWAKGSKFDCVSEANGTTVNREYTKPYLLSSLNRFEFKLQQIYSFIITLLPYIDSDVFGSDNKGIGAISNYSICHMNPATMDFHARDENTKRMRSHAPHVQSL